MSVVARVPTRNAPRFSPETADSTPAMSLLLACKRGLSSTSTSPAMYVSFAVAFSLAASIANLSQSIPITRSNLSSSAFAKNPEPQ